MAHPVFLPPTNQIVYPRFLFQISVLPIVVNGQTRHHTLTQSYYVTRLVEAVKTVPPMEAYDFIPTSAFTDLGNVLDEAGSEKREQLLPG